MVDNNLVGGIPTPLKHIFVRQLGWWLCPTEWNVMERHKVPWFQSTNQIFFAPSSRIIQITMTCHGPVGTFIRSMAMYFMARCAFVDETFVFFGGNPGYFGGKRLRFSEKPGFSSIFGCFMEKFSLCEMIYIYICIYIWYIYIYHIDIYIWYMEVFFRNKTQRSMGIFSMSGCFTATGWGYPETWRSLLNERLSCWIAKSFNRLLNHWYSIGNLPWPW